MDNQCKGQVSDRDLMWAQEILQCCSWLPSVAYLRSGGVLVIQAQITCHTAQYALTQLHWLPLLGMKTREAQAWMFWGPFVEGRFENSNLLQSVEPEPYQQHCHVTVAMHIHFMHTNTSFPWAVTQHLRNWWVARSLLLCQSILLLIWIVPFLKWEKVLVSVPSNTIGWLDASLQKVNSIKQAIIPPHY